MRFANLLIQIAFDFLKPLGHGVHRVGQFSDFVVAGLRNAVIKRPACDDARTADQLAQRLEDPPIDAQKQHHRHCQRGQAGDRCQGDPGAVLHAHVRCQRFHPGLQVRRQFVGQPMQLPQFVVQQFDVDLLQHPVFILIQLVNAGERGFNLVDRFALAVDADHFAARAAAQFQLVAIAAAGCRDRAAC